MQDLIDALVKAKQELNTFETSNKKLLDTYEHLKKMSELAESNIRDWCKTNKEDAEVGGKRYQFQQPYKIWFDYLAAKAILPKKLMPILEDITTVIREVDKDKMKRLIADGVFPEILKLSKENGGAYMEEAMSPRVVSVSLDKEKK